MRPTSDLQVGPYVLAALQRALGPECAADEIGRCVAQWAFGTIALGAAVLGLLALAGGVAPCWRALARVVGRVARAHLAGIPDDALR